VLKHHIIKTWVTEGIITWLTITGSGLDDWVYWHFFTITINYYSSQSIFSLTAEVSFHSASRSTTDCKHDRENKRPSLSPITLQHGPPRKHFPCPATDTIYCWQGVLTDILPSNGRPTVVTRLSGKMITGSLPSNGYALKYRYTYFNFGAPI
jgi:hypothetical protein